MVIGFVREQYPQARFERIYDAASDGWGAEDFHRCCDRKGWTLTVVETTFGFIFGGFTTADWDSPLIPISNPGPDSFLFSVTEGGSKYPITSGDRKAIQSWSDRCAVFGYGEIAIASDSNCNTHSYCIAEHPSFWLPAARWSGSPLINGGDRDFQVKQFEVYKVNVREVINNVDI
jgi:hypothetical protein